ncbi:MAG: SGNH/GDSL hydrolase family protein [Spirochaetales bacterium]|nr:SGNH/GDSL hydrolase family protein [Spirochaetales bacterium]
MIAVLRILNDMMEKTPDGNWIVSWGCAQQLTETHNNPPAPHLAGNTLRQLFRVSCGGDHIRLRFSNLFSQSPTEILGVHISRSLGKGRIDAASSRQVLFGGGPSFVIPPGGEVCSDSVSFGFPSMADLAVTIFFGKVSPEAITGHPGSRMFSYLKRGNCLAETDMQDSVQVEHWYILAGLETMAGKNAATFVAIGDSLTDGRGSTTDGNNRWTDNLVRRLYADGDPQIGVYNAGIGGNAVLGKGLGPSLLERFSRDVLEQSSVKWCFIMEGVNDIGVMCGLGRKRALNVSGALTEAFAMCIDKAHSRGLQVFGSTITPFGESFYYSAETEDARQAINKWIRNEARYDAVFDMDRALADPSDPRRLRPQADCGDHLHLSPEGYKIMADQFNTEILRQE